MPLPPVSYVDLPAGRFAYREDGDGPACLLLHGIPTSAELWHAVFPILAEGKHVYALDFLGYGDSDKPEPGDLSVAAQATYVLDFLTSKGLERVLFVGHDIGGGVAQIVAAEAPERVAGLVLVDAIIADSWPVPDIDRLKEPTWDETFERLDLGRGFRRAFLQGMVHQDKVTDDFVARYVRPFADLPGRMAYLRVARALNSRDLTTRNEAIMAITAPTLIVWGEQDVYQPIAYGRHLAEQLANARFVSIPDAGHFLPEDTPEKLADFIRSFSIDLA